MTRQFNVIKLCTFLAAVLLISCTQPTTIPPNPTSRDEPTASLASTPLTHNGLRDLSDGENLAELKARCANEPAPSGRILFTRAFTDTDGIQKYDLFYYDLGTKHLSRALKSPAPTAISPLGYTSQGLLLPGRVGGRLSADGKKLAFYDFSSIIVTNADGGNPTIVDSVVLHLTEAVQWSPDSNAIAYVDFISHTAKIATLTPSLKIRAEKPDIPFFSMSSLNWPRNVKGGVRIYSAGCVVQSGQCSVVSSSYLNIEGRTSPVLLSNNTVQPRWSPTSNIIAMLATNSGVPGALRLVLSDGLGQPPQEPVDVLLSGGYDWAPNSCAIIGTTLDQNGFTLLDLNRGKASVIPIPESLQTLYPQWIP